MSDVLIETDIWTDTDFPVLRTLAGWFTNDEQGPFFPLEELVTTLGWPEGRVGYAVIRLGDAGLIRTMSALWGKPYPMMVTGVTTAGLRASGAWPSEASVLDALIDTLLDLADRQDAANPEEGSKLRAAASVIGRMAVSVGTDFASRLAAHAAGLP
jgi:hypothetical protein